MFCVIVCNALSVDQSISKHCIAQNGLLTILPELCAGGRRGEELAPGKPWEIGSRLITSDAKLHAPYRGKNIVKLNMKAYIVYISPENVSET